MKHLADRVGRMELPKTIAMSKKARLLKAEGKDVISLSLGEPDFNTPDFIKEAGKEGITENFSHYMPVKGFADLREAISKKFKRDNNLDYDPGQIVVSTGAKQSLANVILTLVNPGEEVIIPAPYWVSYAEQTKLAKGKTVVISSSLESGFKITPEQLKNAFTDKSRLMIFSSPNNPSGAIYTQEELDALAEVIATKKDFFVICDEIYEHINYTGKTSSLARNKKIYNQVITINGLSKGFAMTGWRLGYMGAPKWIADACDLMQSQYTSGASSISQRAAIAAVNANPEKVGYMVSDFKERRDLMVGGLREVQGFKVNNPDGAFYIFPYVQEVLNKSIYKTDDDLCNYLLEVGLVATVPGSAFGLPGYIRFSYAAKKEDLIKALNRIKEAVEKLMV